MTTLWLSKLSDEQEVTFCSVSSLSKDKLREANRRQRWGTDRASCWRKGTAFWSHSGLKVASVPSHSGIRHLQQKPGFYREVRLATRIQGGEKRTSCSIQHKRRKCKTLKQSTAFSVRVMLFNAVLTIICMTMNFLVPNGNEPQLSKEEIKEKSRLYCSLVC
jgi:hypothetical protein